MGINQTYAYSWNILQETKASQITVGAWDYAPQWNSTTTYLRGDIVEYNGIKYEAKKTSTNQLPTNNKYWRTV